MKTLTYIKSAWHGAACLNCGYFQSSPAAIEEAYPGLTALSSAYASVCDQDGFCAHHQLYLSARDSCESFKSCETSNKVGNGK